MNISSNRDLYTVFKDEQTLTEQNYNPDEGRNDGKNDKKNEDNTRIPIKCMEFCNILCSLTDCDYNIENLDILINLVKIMKIMGILKF